MTVEKILDQCQSLLHDDGSVWSREELLRWLQDGYRQLLYSSGVVRRPYQLDLPGRVASSASVDWELHDVPGTARIFTRSVGNRPTRVTFLWEVEQVEPRPDDIAPTNSYQVVTQLWEQAHTEDIDSHFRFALPRQSDRPLKVYWDSKRLAHTSVREIDQAYDRWWRDAGEPIATLPGVGPEKSLEVYLLQTDYIQTYDLKGYEAGLPRLFSSSDSDRTYAVSSLTDTWDYAYTNSPDSGMVAGFGLNIAQTLIEAGSRGLYSWESDTTSTTNDTNGDTVGTISTFHWEVEFAGLYVQLGVGTARNVTSPDRQYLGVAYDSGQDLFGIPRRLASSDGALTIWHSIVPERNLTEVDEPDLLPRQCHKYIKFYVLAQAFARAGQGHRPDLAEHWSALYQLGVGLLTVLGTPSVFDRVYAREQVRDASIQAPPRVRMPATFPIEGRFL